MGILVIFKTVANFAAVYLTQTFILRKKMKTKLLIPVLMLLILAGCNRFRKQEPIDKLYGAYQGKVTYIFRFSKVNNRLSDQRETRDCRIAIYKHSNVTYMKCAEGVLVLSGLTPGDTSVTFSIRPQKFTEAKEMIPVQGKPLRFIRSRTKADAYFETKYNKLIFSYKGIVPFDKGKVHVNIPVEAYYRLRKIDIEALKSDRMQKIRNLK